MHPNIHNRPFGVSDALPHSDWDTQALIIFEQIDDIANPTIIHCRSDVVLECIKKRSIIEATLERFFKFVVESAVQFEERYQRGYQELLHEKREVVVNLGNDTHTFCLSMKKQKKYKFAVALIDEDGKTVDEQSFDM